MSKEAKMFSTFLQALAQGHARVIEVEIDPNLPINVQIEAQLEAHLKDAEVRHRETCPACAAAHEKEQAKMDARAKQHAADHEALRKTTGVPHVAEDMAVNSTPKCEALQKLHYMETEALVERQLQERHESGLYDEPTQPTRSSKLVKFNHIGYMAFDGDKPIDKTFDADRDTVEQGIQQFLDDPMTQMMRAFTNGAGFPDLKIKSIFTRDDL